MGARSSQLSDMATSTNAHLPAYLHVLEQVYLFGGLPPAYLTHWSLGQVYLLNEGFPSLPNTWSLEQVYLFNEGFPSTWHTTIFRLDTTHSHHTHGANICNQNAGCISTWALSQVADIQLELPG